VTTCTSAVSRFQITCHLHLLPWRQMQKVPMSDGTICRTVRRHTPEVATFSNIPTAHSLLRLYMGRECSVGKATHYGLHGLEIESWLRRDFPHSSRLDLGPVQLSEKWITGLFPGGKTAGAWGWPPATCSVEVKEKVQLHSHSPSRTSWPALGWLLYFHTTNACLSFRRTMRQDPRGDPTGLSRV
jgi:hypothetical protein